MKDTAQTSVSPQKGLKIKCFCVNSPPNPMKTLAFNICNPGLAPSQRGSKFFATNLGTRRNETFVEIFIFENYIFVLSPIEQPIAYDNLFEGSWRIVRTHIPCK